MCTYSSKSIDLICFDWSIRIDFLFSTSRRRRAKEQKNAAYYFDENPEASDFDWFNEYNQYNLQENQPYDHDYYDSKDYETLYADKNSLHNSENERRSSNSLRSSQKKRVWIHMGPSKNILNTAPKKMGRLDQMKVFIVLIIVMILVYISLITRYRELGRPNFLQDIFGLTHISQQQIDKSQNTPQSFLIGCFFGGWIF